MPFNYKNFIKKPTLAAYRLFKLAEEGSEAYITQQVPLNESLKKIAIENDLLPEEVKRCAEFMNHIVYQYEFEKQADKTFTFPVADAKEVLAEINHTVINKDYKIEIPPYGLYNEPIKFQEKKASQKDNTLQKLVEAKKEINEAVSSGQFFKLSFELERNVDEFRTEVINAVLDGNTLGNIKYALDSCFPNNKSYSEALLSYINTEFKKSPTFAKYATDEIQCIGDSNVGIINDRHPLIIKYKKILDNISDISKEEVARGAAKRIERELDQHIMKKVQDNLEVNKEKV